MQVPAPARGGKSLQKDKTLMEAFKTIPQKATYTCHDIQNDIIKLTATAVTQDIVQEIGS